MIRITTNAAELSDQLSAVISKQLAFVTAKSLTDIAHEVRKEETDKLPQYFNIRTNWSKRTLKVIRAEKRDFPNAYAILGVRDKVMALNVTGGQRKPESGGSMGVPNEESRSFLNPSNKTLGPAKRAGRIANKKFGGNKPFIISKPGKERMVIRTGKKQYPLLTLYEFKRDVKINETWPLINNTSSIVKSIYAKRFSENLNKALRK